MKRRVLVVEDDPSYCKLLKLWLESEGCQAILAETLEAGFVNIAAEPLPDVVLLDIHLENHSGLILVEWVRKQRHLSHIPIVAVTGYVSLKDQKSIQDAGCDACLAKPIDFDALRKFLAALGVHSII